MSLTKADITTGELVREFYSEMYSEDEALNRVLSADDDARVLEYAVTEPVIQIYPPNRVGSDGMTKLYRCTFDVCAPTFDAAERLAEVAEDALNLDVRRPKPYNDPRLEWIVGTRFARYRVTFALKLR